jgi:hypothetical protein
VVGYSVALKTKDGGSPVWFGGGKLARDLTLPSLRQFWEVSAEDRKSAAAEWRATKSVTPGKEAILGGPDDWQRASLDIERAVEKLREIPVSDLAAWRAAALEAAGVFASWSRRFEGDSPGPMVVSADALVRSGQNRPGDSGPSRAASRDIRGIAAMVAQSELGNDSPIAWAMLIGQLGRTLRTIGDAHVARAETEMAKVLVDRLSAELTALHERVATSLNREQVPREQAFDERVAMQWLGGVGITLEIGDDLDLNLDRDVDFER